MPMRVCTASCAVEKMNAMCRRHQRRVVAMAVLLLVLLPPPAAAALSAPLPPGAIDLIVRFTIPLRTLTTKAINIFVKQFWEQVAEHIVKELLEGDHFSSPSGAQNKTVEPERSADSARLFIFNLTVGTPSPQNISGILDITTELVWAQCAPCSGCLPPPAPTFQPNRSASFARLPCGSHTCQQGALRQTCSPSNTSVPCDYVAVYDDDTNTTGHLAQDTFTFGDIPVRNMVFGCSSAAFGNFSGASGFFGFNRGPLSLVSQLRLSWFSYLWTNDSTGTGSDIQFGSGTPPQTQNSRSTSLLTSTMYPNMYFVSLTGIRVDGDLLGAIPASTFDFKTDGSGGVLLSTTVPVTYLEQPAYDVVRKAIATKITAAQPVNRSALGLGLCYTTESLKNVTVPKLALVFQGVDAVMDLQRYNYFLTDSDSGLDCLTIMPSLGGSVLGSLVQRGSNMSFDIAHGQLIFETAAQRAAASRAHSVASLTMMVMVPYYLAVWVMLF